MLAGKVAGVGAGAALGLLGHLALDLLAPSRCAVCDERRTGVGGGGVCSRCWGSLPLITAACPLCAIPTDGSSCRTCSASPPPVYGALGYGIYSGAMAALVKAFKFGSFDTLAEPAADRLATKCRSAAFGAGCDAVVPIPSTRRRNRARGYDPAVVLAGALGRRLGLPMRELLSRRRDTPPQSALPAADRADNVRGAFQASRRAAEQKLLLVDDVVTTGATAFEAARTLREAGAAGVALLFLARTPEPDAPHGDAPVRTRMEAR